MEVEKFFELIFTNSNETKQTECPDLEAICAYSDNSLPLNSRCSMDEHLLNCSFCFDNYISICKEMENSQEIFATPPWLKSKAIGKSNVSLLNSLIANISKKWVLSWTGGFAFGIVVTIMLFLILPLQIFSDNPGIKIIGFHGGNNQSPSINYVSTGSSDLHSACIHYQKGEEFLNNSTEKAKEEFIQAIKDNTDYAEAHWQLAILYEKEGNYNESLRHWKRYLFLTPKIGSYEQAKKHMENLNKFLEN